MGNKNLAVAKKAKNDEFYTQLTDIERELKHYRDEFKDKIVFCNCDNPEHSNFWKYFKMNFHSFGLKKLISTHYDSEKPTYKLEYDGNESIKTDLMQNGDFRSPEVIEILKEADIVSTNPPFSLFREYIAQLIEYDKEFVVIGNQNAITYKEIFRLLRDSKMWIGYNNGSFKFKVPRNFDKKNVEVDKKGDKYAKFGNISWFTNLNVSKRNEEMPLYKKYSSNEYPKYDNYNAINIKYVKDIPVDYYGVMGVPITFMNKYNPEQFEILGITDRQNTSGLRTYKYTKEDSEKFNDLNARCVLKIESGYKPMYARILIRRIKELTMKTIEDKLKTIEKEHGNKAILIDGIEVSLEYILCEVYYYLKNDRVFMRAFVDGLDKAINENQVYFFLNSVLELRALSDGSIYPFARTA